MKKFFRVIGLTACLCAFQLAHAQLPADFNDEQVVGGLTQPTDFTQLPSGEMLLLEKRGKMLLTDPSATSAVASTYMTIPNVDGAKEKGLLAIALDPDFQSNNFFYVFYHNAATDRARISRYLHDGTSASAQSEFVIWEDNLDTSLQEVANHYGGGMSFGPDGFLYYTYGDKKDFPDDAQDLLKTAGKILRLNTSGASLNGPWEQGSDNAHLIPDDNPFIDGPGGQPDEMWALGLRNPFRAKWDLPTGQLFIGEVGDNVQSGPDASFEDVHVATTASAGVNFGYPACEGPACRGGTAPDNYSAPIFSIRHPDARAIVLGPIYRGNQFPDQYKNALFFGDYAKGWLRYLTFDSTGAVSADVPAGGYELAPLNTMRSVVSIGAGADGALYYLTLGPLFGNFNGKGQLKRISYDSLNQPPVITAATASPTTGTTQPLTVEFSGSGTSDNGSELTFQWDFGDGSTANEANTTHTYTANGEYQAVLSVSDGLATTNSTPVTISIGTAPVAGIATPGEDMLFRAGDVIQIRGSGSDPDGTLTNDNLRWTIGFNHDEHIHPVLSNEAGSPCQPAGSSCISFTIPDSGHDFSGDTSYEISLEVTDSSGLSDTQTVSIYPDKVDLSFGSDFPGDMTILLDQLPRSLPFELDTVIGYKHSIEAPAALSNDGNSYSFSGWSNGPEEVVQEFTVAPGNTSFDALYTNDGPASFPLTGLVAHFAADTGVSLSGGAEVTGWTDQSGRGNDLSAVGNPTLVTNALNGQPVIDFDGDGDALFRNAALSAFPTGDQDRTVYMVVSYRGVGSGGFGFGTAARNRAFGLSVGPFGNLRVNGYGPTDKVSNTAGTDAGWIVQSARVSSDQLVHSVNGLEIDSAVRSYATAGDMIVLGADIDQSPAVDMQVAAVMVYDRALSAEEQSLLQSYLQEKYFSTTPGNQAPIAVADNVTVEAGDTVVIPILANDTDDVELAVNSVEIVSVVSAGQLNINTDGTVSYTHDGGLAEDDTFTYTVQDNQGLVSNAATVTITIGDTENNQPPVALADNATVETGDTVVIAVLANDTDDVELAVNSVEIVSAVSAGQVNINTDGSVSYTHDGGLAENDTFTYTVQDNQGLVSNEATVTITIGGTENNQPPVALADNATVKAGGTVVINVLANDVDDVELAVNTVQVVSDVSAGTLQLNSDGSVSYTNNQGSSLVDTFTYTVEDDQGLVSNAATVTVSITGVVGEPSIPIAGLVAHFATDVGVSLNNSGQVTAWSDQSGQGNDLSSVGNPMLIANALNGQPVIDFDGDGDALLRKAALNAFPTGDQDRSVYMVVSYHGVGSGGFGYGKPAWNQTFGLSVDLFGDLRVNAFGPSDKVSNTAGTNAGWIVQSAQVSSDQLVHSVNGLEIDSATRSYATAGDMMVLGADLDQLPAVDMQIAAVLVYNRALNSIEEQSLQKYFEQKYFDVTVTGNQPPSAMPDSATVATGDTVVIGVLDNDTDDSGVVPTSINIVSDASTGDTTVNTDGTITYIHNNSSNSIDTFTYTVLDAEGLVSNEALVTVSITGDETNDIPLLGLVSRFESDTLVAADGAGVVSSWGDQASAANTLVAAGTPTLVPSALNGMPVIDFNGTNDVLQKLSGVTGLPAGASDRSVYAVVNYRSTGFGGVSWGTAALNETFGLVVSTNGALAVQGWGVSNDFRSGTAGTNQGWLVQSATVTSNTVRHYLNAMEVDSQNHIYNTVPNTIVVGAEIDGRPFINMQVAAIFVYDRALNSVEQQMLQSYLIQKYF